MASWVTFAVAVIALAAPATGSAASPNLRVAAVSAPATVESGGSIAFSDATANRGRASAPASSTAYFLSKDTRRDASDTRLGTRKVPALARNRRNAGSRTLRVDADPGTYRVVACADVGKRIRETSERDNCTTARGRLQVVATTQPGSTAPAPESQPPASAELPGATTDATTTTPPPPPPAAPGKPFATPRSSSRIDLNWPAVSGITRYKVLRHTASGGPYTLVGESGSTGFSDTGLAAFTDYYYVVVAVGEGGDSAASPEATARTQFACEDDGLSSAPGTNVGLLAGDAPTLRDVTATLCTLDTDWFQFDVAESTGATKDLEVRLRNISTALGTGAPHSIEMCVWYFNFAGTPDRCLTGPDVSLGIVNNDGTGVDDGFSLFVRLRNTYVTTPAQSYLRADGAVPCGQITPCDDIG